MLSEEELGVLADIFADKYGKISTEILEDIAKTVKQTGDMIPSQAEKLQKLYEFGVSVDDISKRLAKETGRALGEIEDLYTAVAKEGYDWAKPFYEAKDIKQIPFSENKILQDLIKSASSTTGQGLLNLSNTTVLGIGNGKDFQSLNRFYTDTLDRAIFEVSTGVKDYNSAIRDAVKNLGTNGLRVQYESGITKRLDSAVRQNVLDGVSYLAREANKALGEDFGADGVEITAHYPCAPDHIPFQGEQFSDEEFKNIQDELERPIGQWNCGHVAYPILLGVSKPTHSKSELSYFEKQSNEKILIEGKAYTRYECKQLQRKFETALRNAREEKRVYEAYGNRDLVNGATEKIRILSNKYVLISREAGLPFRADSTRSIIKGLKDKKLENLGSSGIIKSKNTFIPAKSVEDANTYAREVLGIKNASYKGADVATANAWNEGLKEAFDRFPKLKENFGFVGTVQERNKLIKNALLDDYMSRLIKKYPGANINEIKLLAKEKVNDIMKEYFSTNKAYAEASNQTMEVLKQFNGVSVNSYYGKDYKKLIEFLTEDVQGKWRPAGTDNVKAVLDHEIGHSLDPMLGIREVKEVQTLFDSRTKSEITEALSEYAWNNSNSNKYGEFIAEAWAEYCNNPKPREVANAVGKIIEDAYRKKYE